MRSVLITGAGGTLGARLTAAFARAPWCGTVVALDRPVALARTDFGSPPHTPPGTFPVVRPLALDLLRDYDEALAQACADVDTIVHFAVPNPLPDATWEEAERSFAMTARLLLAAREAGHRRFVFASSNHAVGRLKEDAEALAPGSLTADRLAPGTHWETPDGFMEGYGYGAAKVFGESLCAAAARRDGLTTVSIRIGWCQGGENRAETLNASGNPKVATSRVQAGSGALRWFRNMWLSNRDFEAVFERAVLADASGWPTPGIAVNGVSANAGMPWEIASAERLIGYRPQDDVWAALETGPSGAAPSFVR